MSEPACKLHRILSTGSRVVRKIKVQCPKELGGLDKRLGADDNHNALNHFFLARVMNEQILLRRCLTNCVTKSLEYHAHSKTADFEIQANY
jgi:hypothetical protein